MARKLREDFEGAIHHVYARGNDRQAIFLSDLDRRFYLATLRRVVMERGWGCLAYCLMPNHVHLLIETPRANLGRGMQVLHGKYAQRFNQRHGRHGHLFQGRFGAVRVKDDAQLWMAAAYIAGNPVRAGLCERPEEWRWSSHAAIVSGRAPFWLDVARLLSFFEIPAAGSRRRYVGLVGARLKAA